MLASCPSDLARVACVAVISDHKVSNRNHIKILTPKQMPQRLRIAIAQVKSGSTSENLLNKIRCILFIEQKKLLKKYIKI